MKTSIALRLVLAALPLFLVSGTAFAQPDATAAEAQTFLETYNRTYQSLSTVANEAAWSAVTDVTDEHTGQRIGDVSTRAARELNMLGAGVVQARLDVVSGATPAMPDVRQAPPAPLRF